MHMENAIAFQRRSELESFRNYKTSLKHDKVFHPGQSRNTFKGEEEDNP
jgi:hypothetical protein